MRGSRHCEVGLSPGVDGCERTPRRSISCPRRRKPSSNLGQIWVETDEKTDVGPFASARWALISTQTDRNGAKRTKWINALELPLEAALKPGEDGLSSAMSPPTLTLMSGTGLKGYVLEYTTVSYIW